MLSVIYAEYHLCWESSMLNAIMIKSIMLCPYAESPYAECHLC
jgi:hypothetical protein